MANAFTPAQPCSKVYLTIKANTQIGNNSLGNGEWIELGRTEIVWNCLNPEFATKIMCDYLFEERQKVKFELYDADSMSSDLSKHDFLGYCDCYLAEIVSARTYTKNLGGLRGNCGSITVCAEEVDEGSKEQAEFHVRATKLDRKDIFGSSDPFLRIYRILDNGRPFLIECWDHEYDGSHQFIGSCEISAEEILTRTCTSIPLLNNDLFCRSLCCMAYQNSGILHFTHFQIVKSYSFLDYIQAGTQLDFTVAVDLTASNGDPRKPSSLHYISSKAPSQYEVAIRAVVEICQYYNKTKRFNAYGFGAITPGNKKASEIFNLASFLPLSIIIVGVGDEEFDSMDELDSDDSLLAFEGRQAQRDIVQFIPLRQFLRGPVTGMEGERVMELLAKEVLAEVPLQLTSYMELNRISPRQQNDNNSELEMSFTSSPAHSDRSHPFPTAPPIA
ncbi:Copine [Ancylostoma duodenale]|uniref:Copine n=1 Tax=Ancylostoma duodenale TaxID=51022 RepID=A0A0C2CN00_9BILA|nr:Copine [Ancylostoma duodenale]